MSNGSTGTPSLGGAQRPPKLLIRCKKIIEPPSVKSSMVDRFGTLGCCGLAIG